MDKGNGENKVNAALFFEIQNRVIFLTWAKSLESQIGKNGPFADRFFTICHQFF